MKLEFYALFIFLVSVVLFAILIVQKKEFIQEEVLPSPFLYVKNPFEKNIQKMKNEINKQLFFLEYGIPIPSDLKDFSKLRDIIFQINDPRAKKEIIKVVWQYWWGRGIESVTFKVKHINISWYPAVYPVNSRNSLTFGEALYNALNGNSSSFSVIGFDMELVRLICEKYKVEFVLK